MIRNEYQKNKEGLGRRESGWGGGSEWRKNIVYKVKK